IRCRTSKEGEIPPAEKQGDANRAGGDHAGIFAEEEQGEPHGAVFGVITADQFLLGLGGVKRRAVGLGVNADEKHDESERLSKYIPGGDDSDPTVALL